MRDNTIQIGDNKGKFFKIEIWTPGAWRRLKFWKGEASRARLGDWRAVDMGFIRYSSGDAYRMYNGHGNTDADLWLGLAGDFDDMDERFPGFRNNPSKWDPIRPGLVLYDYDDWEGTNDNGKGKIDQGWVLGLAPGEITWSRLDD